MVSELCISQMSIKFLSECLSCFMTSQKFFRSTGDISIVDERLQNLGLH